METRASHVLIGGFVLLVIVGLFAFVIWLARVQIDREFARYDIYFEGSVAGLGIGGDVSYRGIRVGTVISITVNPDDPSRVRVIAEIGSDTLIREGDQASLQLQGITGVAFVNSEGATAEKPLIGAKADEPRPVIPSKPSQIEKLFQGAPELINRGIILTERASELFDAGMGREAPESQGARFSMANWMREAGRAEEAIPILREFLARVPDEAQQAVGRYNLARALISAGHEDEADEQLRAAFVAAQAWPQPRRDELRQSIRETRSGLGGPDGASSP